MSSESRMPRALVLGIGFAAGLLVGVGMLVGALAALRGAPGSHWAIGERAIAAATTAGGDQFAMATGPIDDEVEGLFVLDQVTGELLCTVLNPRSGKFQALFRANVAKDLEIEKSKKPKFLMTTGNINAVRGGAAARPALTVAYVLDENTGNFCVYSLPWQKELANAGQAQNGQLFLQDKGKARLIKLPN